MPELPRDKRRRLIDALGVSEYAAKVLTGHPAVAAFFEEAARLHGDATKVANFVQSEVLGDVEVRGLRAEIPLTPAQVASLLRLVDAGTISGKQAKEVYAKITGTDRAPEDVVRELGMRQVSDASAIEAVCKRVIEQNPKQADQLRSGKMAVMGFFVGQVMKETGGSATRGWSTR